MENKINLLLRKMNSHMKVHYLRNGQMRKRLSPLRSMPLFPWKRIYLKQFLVNKG